MDREVNIILMKMNVSISVFDVGVWVNVHPTFAHNIFMLCAMLLVARLCTGEGGSQSSSTHSFVFLAGGWVFTLLPICTYVVGLPGEESHMKFGLYILT